MNKGISDYLNLPYKLVIVPLKEGGYYAQYPELGAHGDAPTIEEAVKEANVSKELMLESYLEHGDYPVPEPHGAKDYSGKFNVRVPKSLHRELTERAQEEGVNLKALVSSLLQRGLSSRFVAQGAPEPVQSG